MKNCIICGASFAPRRPPVLCCSAACSKQRNNIYTKIRKNQPLAPKPASRKCAHCSKSFAPISAKNIFCSGDCSYMEGLQRSKLRLKTEVYWQETRACKICNKIFVVQWKQATKRVCEGECERKNQLINDAASRARRLARMTQEEREEYKKKKREYMRAWKLRQQYE